LIASMSLFLAKTPPKPDDADNPIRIANCSPMPNEPSAFMKRFNIEAFIVGFGMTEAGIILGNQGQPVHPKSCGKVVDGYQVRLVDNNDIPVAVGQPGELIVRTNLPWAMNAGYWRRPEATAQAWRNGWFHTGDILYCDDEGQYFFADRKKDAVRRRGENISSFEVEREVMAYPDVLEAACVGAPGEFGDDEVKVFVVPKDGINLNPSELIQFLISRMPHFMVPRFIEILETLPKTPSGRVKKYELRDLGNNASTWDRETAGIKVKRNS